MPPRVPGTLGLGSPRTAEEHLAQHQAGWFVTRTQGGSRRELETAALEPNWRRGAVAHGERCHLSLSTPRLHQGSDSPPHTGEQWPTPLSSTWPDSGASPVRVRTNARGISRDRPRCVVRPLLDPVSNCVKGRKKILSLEGTTEQPYTRPVCFLQL